MPAGRGYRGFTSSSSSATSSSEAVGITCTHTVHRPGCCALPFPSGSRSLLLRLLVRYCQPRCGRARLRVSVGLSCGLGVPLPCCALSFGFAGGVRKARPAPHLVHHDRHVIAVDLEQHGADAVLRKLELVECVHHLSTRDRTLVASETGAQSPSLSRSSCGTYGGGKRWHASAPSAPDRIPASADW